MINQIHISRMELAHKCDGQYSNFSIGHGSGGFINDILALNFKAAVNDTESEAGHEADVWNRLDPTQKYPMPANATCQQLDVLTQQLQGELAWTDQQSAQQGQTAKTAAGNYI